MGDGGGDHEQQSGGGGEGGGKSPGGHQRHHPVGQLGNLGVGQHHDVAVDVEFVGRGFVGIGHQALPVNSPLRSEGGSLFGDHVARHVLHPSIVVFIHPGQQVGVLPALHPAGQVGIRLVAHGVDQVGAGEGRNGGGGGVQDGDKHQSITGR